jgi:hypothetical protein
MEDKNKEYLGQASECWQSGKPLEAGRLIFENLSAEVRPKWASRILELVVKRTGIRHSAVEYVLRIAGHPSQWKDAHAAFSSVRTSVLELIRADVRSADQMLLLQLLGLAELVAKVVYNSTNPPDEFDVDAGWSIAVSLKDILDLLKDHDFSRMMWSALCFEEL